MGKQEFGETVAQCAVRETREETGVTVEVILLGRPVSGQPTANDEASDVDWFAPGQLTELDVHPTQWRQLRDWLGGTHPHID
jgi:8-oxo-dGTP pyrophosphatase MutT (NUDIX family)